MEVENVLVRAYADDTALVVKDLRSSLDKLEELFAEFEKCSGLRLNMKKPVIVHLTGQRTQDNEKDFLGYANRWRDVRVTDHAKYLGFILGARQRHEVMAQTAT